MAGKKLSFIARVYTKEYVEHLINRVLTVKERTGKQARFLESLLEQKVIADISMDYSCMIKEIRKALKYIYKHGNPKQRQQAAQDLRYESTRFTFHEMLIEKGLPTFGI